MSAALSAVGFGRASPEELGFDREVLETHRQRIKKHQDNTIQWTQQESSDFEDVHVLTCVVAVAAVGYFWTCLSYLKEKVVQIAPFCADELLSCQSRLGCTLNKPHLEHRLRGVRCFHGICRWCNFWWQSLFSQHVWIYGQDEAT